MDNLLTYKEKPLVRKGNVIYFGDMAEKYITRLTVLTSQNDVAEKIKIELMLSDTGLDEKSRVTKSSEKVGFYEALDIAYIWLTRANKE